ncbi:unnamed protein product [Danaus chrysippus]|uniref:(African queen) hypothetical protein n=1 Tax=Danaus chrysippus TaxID=151541 RepID=A0A8J2VUP6_9NEOP|nr:unnamed protein product [Danaus chrysippus]
MTKKENITNANGAIPRAKRIERKTSGKHNKDEVTNPNSHGSMKKRPAPLPLFLKACAAGSTPPASARGDAAATSIPEELFKDPVRTQSIKALVIKPQVATVKTSRSQDHKVTNTSHHSQYQ